MKITVVRTTPQIVVTAPAQDAAPKVVVNRTTQSIVVKRDGLAGPRGPQGSPGTPGADGVASIPEILDGGNF